MRLSSLFPLVVFLGACDGATASGFDTTNNVGLGGACDERKICRQGLTCTAGICQAAGTTKQGQPCTVGAECESGICGPDIVATASIAPASCQPAGTGLEGDSCGGDNDCSKGLRCGFDGKSFFPHCVKEGTGDVGAACTKNTDCLQGLMCTTGQCLKPRLPSETSAKGIPPIVPGISEWKGATCPDPAKGDVKALFKVPRASDMAHDDFYRLPFPNDAARNKATGKVSFANHPKDPAPPMGFDALGLYLKELEGEPFSNYPAVYFRFDGDFDFDSVQVGTDDPQTRFVDLTAGTTFGQRLGLGIFLTNGRNRYICPNYVVVHPGRGGSLTPGHTYGVIMKKGPTSCVDRKDGKCSSTAPIKQDADFTAMVADTPPTDAALKDAYDAYKPLRDWLVKEGKKADDLLVASVFTVGDPGRVASRLRASVRAATAPAATGWVKCQSGVKSPCPQADEKDKRACGTGDPDFDEYHALVDLPIFQKGTAPYLTSADGGAIEAVGPSTEPIAPVRTEKVCMAVTVPKTAAPASGYPVTIYAHGTGGSFRSHAIDGSGRMLAKAGFATVGIDQVQHGPRRGESKMHPNDLFFNFANPHAARYNAQQGAADQHALVRLLENLTISDGTATIKLDGTKTAYWGHSQGATEGAIFLASDTNITRAVFSGQGATLVDALVTKTQPVNIKDSMWIALSEGTPKAVDGNHPVLALLQAWADPADPLHYARADVVVPGAMPTTPALLRNLFQVMGKGDTFTPVEVQGNFALAAGLAFVGPEVIPGLGMPVASAEGNVTSGSLKSTAAFRQYSPTTKDGHFVAFEIEQARTDVTNFLSTVVTGTVPKIP
jgi:hypothetical protein